MPLLSKAKRDAEFTQFIERSSPALLRVAIGLTGNADAGRELLQASLVKAYVSWPKIGRGDAAAYAYTRRVMANHRIDVWRATRHEVPTDVPPEREDAATDQGPTGSFADRDQLVRLLAGLPRQQRAVLVLRYVEDLSLADVAATLNVSVGTVKSAASRGLAVLRSRVSSPESFDDPLEAGAR